MTISAIRGSKPPWQCSPMQTFIIAVLTADGLIAESTDQKSTDWTSKEDKKFFSERTKQAGVVVFGYNTYKTIGKPLRGRLNIVYSNKSTDFLAGSDRQRGSDPAKKSGDGMLEITQKSPADLIKELEARGYKEVAICGGATIYTMFMEAGVVDKLYLTIEPVAFGAGMTMFNKKFDVKRFKLLSMQKLGEGTVLLEYDVIR